MLDTWISFADGFILIYSIDSKESFEAVKGKYERIIRNKKDQDPKIIVVGNKCDLVEKRKVDKLVVEEQCKQWGVNCLESSALVLLYFKISKKSTLKNRSSWSQNNY
jgi:GTPase SAR1 family protein